MRGEYDDARVDVPVRWLTGTKDPVITPDLTDAYEKHIADFEVELVDGVGHPSLGDGDAVAGEVLLALVFEKIHRIRSSLSVLHWSDRLPGTATASGYLLMTAHC